MLSKLKLLTTASALALMVACSQNGQAPDATVTLQDIQNTIKTTCNYVPTIESIASVAATIVSGINPAAGAATTVGVAVSNSLVTEICKAVQTQAASLKKGTPKGEQSLTVTVNGVEVHGVYVPPAEDKK